MEFPKQIKDTVYGLLQEPTLDHFREFLQDQTGEHNAIDFKQVYKEFGYKYDRSTKGYIQERLPEEKTLDYFVCLHRESLTSSARDKQVFFLKDGQDRQFYVLDNHFPIMQNFSRLIQSLQN